MESPKEGEEICSPHNLAKKFESQIKSAIAQRFNVPSEDLRILLEDGEGVYFSKRELNTLCCLVVGQKNGFMYLVTAKVESDELKDYKSDIIA